MQGISLDLVKDHNSRGEIRRTAAASLGVSNIRASGASAIASSIAGELSHPLTSSGFIDSPSISGFAVPS
jgi:hypothetical protein